MATNRMNQTKVIAFYLPQFHPMPENDLWWGPGFTEWTSVAKARPLYNGHVQPHLPANLGFYDLRLSESREDQAEMAKKAGVYGFCYWHYWFEGKQLMNRPFDEVVKSGTPDFPFCVAWANHSWHKKNWARGNGMFAGENEVLIKQTYGGEKDYTEHFYSLLDAFKDKRYIKIHGRLLFMIYNDMDFGDFPLFSKVWNQLAVKEGLPGFYFVTHACVAPQISNIDKFLDEGYDAVNVSLHRMPFKSEREVYDSIFARIKRKIRVHFKIKPEVVDYKDALRWMDNPLFENPKIFPTIIPNWDHTPRSGRFGRVFQNCTPELFRKHIDMILDRIRHKDTADSIIFLKSWNEWGEGNYIEPDTEYGMERLNVLRDALEPIS